MKGPDVWVRRHLLGLRTYAAARHVCPSLAGGPGGHAAGRLLLDANENAFGPSAPDLGPGVHRYPDPRCTALRSALARWLGVEDNLLWLGNGSDDALDRLLRAFVEPGEPVVIVGPTYGMYAVAARAHGAVVRAADLDGRFDLDAHTTLRAAAGAKVIFLCSPNNPTGNVLSPDRIALLLRDHNGLVVVDEAYIEFARTPSLVPWAGEHRNLVVLRTFSKAWGLAGVRVGYAVADPAVVEYMDRVSLPYPLGTPAVRAACRALQHAGRMAETVLAIVRERTRLTGRLARLGLRVFPSEANFLLVRVPGAQRVQRRLADEFGILVRYRGDAPRLADCLRVTVGRPPENDRLCAALEALLP